MNGLLIVGIWLVIAFCLYLFIMWLKKETNKFNESKFKPDKKDYLKKLGGGIQ